MSADLSKHLAAIEDDAARAAIAAALFAETPAADVLRSKMDVVRFLQAKGYKIRKSKVYADEKKGLLRANADGSVSETEALAYAARVDLSKQVTAAADNERYLRLKQKEELRSIKLKNEKMEREKLRDAGDLIARVEAEAEIADNLNVMVHAFRHLIETRHEDWLAMAKSALKLKTAIIADLTALLDELAGRGEIRVRYQDADRPAA